MTYITDIVYIYNILYLVHGGLRKIWRLLLVQVPPCYSREDVGVQELFPTVHARAVVNLPEIIQMICLQDLLMKTFLRLVVVRLDSGATVVAVRLPRITEG